MTSPFFKNHFGATIAFRGDMTQDENLLRVPTTPVSVGIKLRGHKEFRAEIYIPGSPRGSVTRQVIIERLAQDERFLPVFCPDENRWMLVNKKNILWITVATEKGNAQFELFDRRSKVKFHFDDEMTIEGEMLFSPPVAGRRVRDHLNQSSGFFSLFQFDQVCLINIEAVVFVIEQDDEKVGEDVGED